MRMIVAVGLIGPALLLAGCAKGATIKTTIGQGSPLCADLTTFAAQAAGLTDAATETRAALLGLLPPVHDMLMKLQGEAPATDTINGKPLKTDLGTVAGEYSDLITDLNAASATDPAAVTNALHAVNAKGGQALTDAANRLDAYASAVCKVSTSSPSVPTSTTAGPVTTSGSTPATAGPVAPTATSSTSTP